MARRKKNQLTAADVGFYLGARGVREVIRRDPPRDWKQSLGWLAVLALGAYAAYEAGGQQSLRFYAQGFGGQS